ncbi:MAG: SDR family NAD(P)-dependent oxidoreductase [Candidatus Humimicrobiaceae bacterium]
MRFTDKVVLITGAGTGIGRGTAVMFAKEGAKVAINSLTIKNGEETLSMVNKYSQGIYIQGDVSISSQAENIVKKTVGKFNQLDILVNNAGIVIPGRVDNTSEESWDKTININLKGIFLISKYAVLQMKKQGYGTIVNISSVAGIKGIKDRAAYGASKGAVVALTKAMATDYIKENIRINCICPGTIYTNSLQDRINTFDDTEKAMQDFLNRQPLGRFGEVEEIASAILYVASEDASFMQGSVLVIDGGMSI